MKEHAKPLLCNNTRKARTNGKHNVILKTLDISRQFAKNVCSSYISLIFLRFFQKFLVLLRDPIVIAPKTAQAMKVTTTVSSLLMIVPCVPSRDCKMKIIPREILDVLSHNQFQIFVSNFQKRG